METKKNKKKEQLQIKIFYFVQCIRKLRYYSYVIYSFHWKSAVEYDSSV